MWNEETKKEAREIGAQIEKAEKILFIAHRNPDPDTIGSATGIAQFCKSRGKSCQLFCSDKLPREFDFLPGAEDFLTEISDPREFDLIFIVDCGADYMTGLNEKFPEIFQRELPVVNFDHHPSNDFFGRWNLVDPTAASATLILTEFFEFLNWEISPPVATAFFCGLATDTGSFQHLNTNPRALRTAGRLLRRGANLPRISKEIFQTHRLEKLKLWGRVLSRAQRNFHGAIFSHISDCDLSETGADASELSGVIDFLNSVPDSKFSLLLTDNGGKVKASLRTLRDDIDVAAIAGKFGGGGHKKAAGFTVSGKLQQETRWKIVDN